MPELNRRSFLGRSSLTVVAAGMAGTLPVAATAITAASPEADATLQEGSALDGPLIAQVTDLENGAISLFSGESEFSIVDKNLAAKLFNATK
jgi:hypothetical protein